MDRKLLLEELAAEALPKHVGIIMDGNGRWAKKRGLPRTFGHRAGVDRLHSVLRMTKDLGIKALSIYAFSSENWKRPKDEVEALMMLLIEFIKKETADMHKEGVKITFMGEIEDMPKKVYHALIEASALTADNNGIVLNIALNYGARGEIVRATKALCEKVALNEISIDEIDEDLFSSMLYTKDLPELDLVIRTSGEKRLSNFMLYQAAYAEFVFVEDHWPDFDDQVYYNALVEFQGRQRRYGGL